MRHAAGAVLFDGSAAGPRASEAFAGKEAEAGDCTAESSMQADTVERAL
jgi:hypothetical protein